MRPTRSQQECEESQMTLSINPRGADRLEERRGRLGGVNCSTTPPPGPAACTSFWTMESVSVNGRFSGEALVRNTSCVSRQVRAPVRLLREFSPPGTRPATDFARRLQNRLRGTDVGVARAHVHGSEVRGAEALGRGLGAEKVVALAKVVLVRVAELGEARVTDDADSTITEQTSSPGSAAARDRAAR